jgi:hypothetical protein
MIQQFVSLPSVRRKFQGRDLASAEEFLASGNAVHDKCLPVKHSSSGRIVIGQTISRVISDLPAPGRHFRKSSLFSDSNLEPGIDFTAVFLHLDFLFDHRGRYCGCLIDPTILRRHAKVPARKTFSLGFLFNSFAVFSLLLSRSRYSPRLTHPFISIISSHSSAC